MQVLSEANRENEINKIKIDSFKRLEDRFFAILRLFTLVYLTTFLIISILQMIYSVSNLRALESKILENIKGDFSVILSETPLEQKAKWLNLSDEEPETLLISAFDFDTVISRDSLSSSRKLDIKLPVSILF